MAASYRVQYANWGCRTRAWYRPACSQDREKIVLKGIVSQNQSALFRKTNNLTKGGIMSASSISADRPADPDIVWCSVLQGLLELVRETAVGCFCLGDFSPHDNGFRNASARASMSLHPTGSVSLNIPPSPIGPSVPHTHSDSDFGAARPAASRLRLQ